MQVPNLSQPTITQGNGAFFVSQGVGSYLRSRSKTLPGEPKFYAMASIPYVEPRNGVHMNAIAHTPYLLTKSARDPDTYEGIVTPVVDQYPYNFYTMVEENGSQNHGAQNHTGWIKYNLWGETDNFTLSLGVDSVLPTSITAHFYVPYPLSPIGTGSVSVIPLGNRFHGITIQRLGNDPSLVTMHQIPYNSDNFYSNGLRGVRVTKTFTGLIPDTQYKLIAYAEISKRNDRGNASSPAETVRTRKLISKPDLPYVFLQDSKSLVLRLDISNVVGLYPTSKFYISIGNTPTNLVSREAVKISPLIYEVKFTKLTPSTSYYFKSSIIDEPTTQTVFSDSVAIYETSYGELFYTYRLSDDGTHYIVTGHELGTTGLTGKITIPSSYLSKPVLYIDDNAFQNYNITGLTIPTTILGIGNSAFEGCINLREILIIPNSVTKIGSRAFAESNIIGPLTIPYSVTSIGSEAFRRCRLITVVNILDGIGTFGSDAFRECSAVDSVIIRGSILTIPDGAFKDCSGLRRLDIVNGVEHIGISAFENCISLNEDLLLPSTIKTIGDSAFRNCSGLSLTLVLPESLTNISANAFNNCNNLSGNLYIPNTVTNIDDGAFENCSRITTLLLSRDLTNIGKRAFRGCTGLAGALVMPMLVTNIGNAAFEGCTGFRGSLTLSYVLKNIGDDAFSGCLNFTSTLYIPDNVITIGNNAFKSCTGFTGGLLIPNSTVSIGDNAFQNCTGMNGSLVLGNKVTSIGAFAFSQCGFDGLLKIPNSVTNIGRYAFNECSRFNVTLTIGTGLNSSINEGVFYGCSGFRGLLTIPNNIRTINKSAFEGCSGFTGLVLPNLLSDIGPSAFKNCSEFAGQLDITSTVRTIGESAFENCSRFTSLVNRDLTRTTIVGVKAFEGTSLSYF
jgi:hypothetical protein